MSPSLAQRVREDEVMDDPHLGRAAHVAALAGLSRINIISRASAALWMPIRDLAARLGRPVRVLDIATGGGDVVLGLLRQARREGVAIEAAGCDISRRAIAFARTRARRAGLSAAFFTCNALSELPGGYDVLTSTLFLHHLEEAQVVGLLRDLKKAASSLVLLDDLRRCRPGLWATKVVPRLLTRSKVVHVDAVLSLRAAFTPAELARLADEAGLAGHVISPHWPWRQLLQWQSP